MAKTLSARAWGAHFLPAIKMLYKLVQLKLSSLTLLNGDHDIKDTSECDNCGIMGPNHTLEDRKKLHHNNKILLYAHQ